MNQQIVIGITGHRDIVVTAKLKQGIKDFFINLRAKEITLLSPLADGADRLVADIYMNVFKEKAHLIVPMPFNQERYIEDFDDASKEEFLEYLKIADEVFEVENTQGCNYKSIGVYVADTSDILLALWDGTFNAKSGGTGDIVAYAKEQAKEVVHFLCDRLQSN
jgi:hypothetical protein